MARNPGAPVTVIVEVGVEPANLEPLLVAMRASLPAFAQQPGCLGATLGLATAGGRIVTVLRWRRLADHEACMQSAAVAAAGAEVIGFLQAGKATMEVRVYEEALRIEAP